MFAFNLIVTRELSLSDFDNGNNLVCLLVETFQNSPRLFVGKRQLFLRNNVTTTSLPSLPGSEGPVNSRCILNSWPSGLEWKLQNHQLFSCLLTVHTYHVLQERSHNKRIYLCLRNHTDRVPTTLSILLKVSGRFKSFQFDLTDRVVFQCLLSDGDLCFLERIPARTCNLGRIFKRKNKKIF